MTDKSTCEALALSLFHLTHGGTIVCLIVILRRKMTTRVSYDFKPNHKGPEESFFLLGPRGSGKSTWLRAIFPDAYVIDLLS